MILLCSRERIAPPLAAARTSTSEPASRLSSAAAASGISSVTQRA